MRASCFMLDQEVNLTQLSAGCWATRIYLNNETSSPSM
jgi:hypothetical protein